MEKLLLWDDIKDEYDSETWKPTLKDCDEFLKEQVDELEHYLNEGNEPFEDHIKHLNKEIQEFKDADFDEKIRLIKLQVYCYCECTPVECYSPLWRRVLGMEE